MSEVGSYDATSLSDPLMRDRKLHSIVPRGSIASSALMFVIMIMAFLASLTLGAVVLVNDTARGWQNDIAREVTIQLRPVEGVDLDDALITVRQIAGSFAGVTAVSVIGDEAMGRLLEPWLGSGLDLEELPVPRLVSVSVDENNPPDFVRLAAKLREAVPGASLDDHRAWIGRLTTMARATVAIGIVIFSLMIIATLMMVVFATRGAMAGNRHIIEVLHFVGAEQGYIAGQFQSHFLLLGFKGALAGGGLAIAVFLALGLWTRQNIADPAADQVAALFGTFTVGVSGYVGTILLVFVIAVLTALTSRWTVFRHVDMLDSSATSGDETDVVNG